MVMSTKWEDERRREAARRAEWGFVRRLFEAFISVLAVFGFVMIEIVIPVMAFFAFCWLVGTVVLKLLTLL